MRRVFPRARIGLLCAAVVGTTVLTVLPSGPAGAATVTASPDADATVAEAAPTTNMGTAPTLQVDQSPVFESYLHFTLTGLTGSVTSARLRLRVVNASVNGPAVYPTDPGWTETGITWATKPAPTGPAAADAGAVAANTWLEYDVTSLVHGDGPIAFTLAGTSKDGSDFASREAPADGPQLVVTTDSSSPPLPPPPPPPPSGTATRVFAAAADARTAKAKPTTNFGTTPSLDVDGSPVVESYLRFPVTGLAGPVRRATLRLWVTDRSVDGPAVYPTGSAWTETGITWATRPARTGAKTADLGAVAKGTWAEFDVTALVTGNGDRSFALAGPAADGTIFASREAANPPELVVTADVGTPDTTPPDTAIGSVTVNGSTATFPFTSTEANSTFECRLDGAAFAGCASPASYPGLAVGGHTFDVRAVDPAGNTDPTPATTTVTVADTIPPDTAIGSVAVDQSTATFAFTSTEANSTFECSLDGGAFTLCASPKSYSGLAVGQHTFAVRASDDAGNADPTPATASVTIEDLTPPDTAIDAVQILGRAARFDFSATEARSSFACSLDGASFASCTAPASYDSLALGDHTFAVQATDPAGNTDPSPAPILVGGVGNVPDSTPGRSRRCWDRTSRR